MKHDLRVRLLLTYFGVSVAALVLLGSVFTAVLGTSVSAAHVHDMRAETSSLAGQLERALAAGARRSTIQRLIRRDSVLLGKRIILLDRAGRARFDSARWTPFSRGSWRMVDLSALRRGQWASLQGKDRFGLQSPLIVHGHEVGAVALVITSVDTGVPWRQILAPLFAVLGALLLVWLAVSFLLARSLSHPLRQISAGLIRVKHGEYDRPIPEEGWSEARSLARRYNDMVAEVARSRKSQYDFVANASHELKTPVALVAGFARSLTDGTARRDDAVAEAVRYIQSESEHLARVVDQLFALASLDANAGAMIYASCQPETILRQSIARFDWQARSRGISFEVRCDAPLPACVWDEERIAAAVSNVICNALEHSGSTLIRTRAFYTGSAVVFEVRDSGTGIPPDDLAHVFDRFYRGGGSRIDGHAGLGLALVVEVVERHGGAVEVESTVGEGTCFTISLPLHAPDSAQFEAHGVGQATA